MGPATVMQRRSCHAGTCDRKVDGRANGFVQVVCGRVERHARHVRYDLDDFGIAVACQLHSRDIGPGTMPARADKRRREAHRRIGRRVELGEVGEVGEVAGKVAIRGQAIVAAVDLRDG